MIRILSWLGDDIMGFAWGGGYDFDGYGYDLLDAFGNHGRAACIYSRKLIAASLGISMNIPQKRNMMTILREHNADEYK